MWLVGRPFDTRSISASQDTLYILLPKEGEKEVKTRCDSWSRSSVQIVCTFTN